MPPQPGQIFSLKKQQRSNDLYSTTQGESDDIFGNILLKTYQDHQKQNKQNHKRVLFQNEATSPQVLCSGDSKWKSLNKKIKHVHFKQQST